MSAFVTSKESQGTFTLVGGTWAPAMTVILMLNRGIKHDLSIMFTDFDQQI
jgi:hypothetical protein